MLTKQIIRIWFEKWETGDFMNLPISENFIHQSPFDTIVGKKEYLDLVNRNKEKFLGYTFDILDSIYAENTACVRYVGKQGSEFKLEVSEWYYLNGNLIEKIVAYYHIGEIRKERQLSK